MRRRVIGSQPKGRSTQWKQGLARKFSRKQKAHFAMPSVPAAEITSTPELPAPETSNISEVPSLVNLDMSAASVPDAPIVQGFKPISTEEILAMDVNQLWKVVEQYDSVKQSIMNEQTRVIAACLRRILQSMHPNSNPVPREDQVRVVRRLIYGSGDTLFIAATGFGKSLIFIAFSILAKKITIQIVPLTKLGEQQYKDIAKLDGTNPIFIQAESDGERVEFFERLLTHEYTHILTSPEVAISGGFQAAIQRPEFTGEIGLVVIDECHLVEQWKDFRIEYRKLQQLRRLLRDEVIWFGCSATITPAKQNWILKHGGFRAIGNEPYETEVIRTNIDRSDVFWEVQPIPYGLLKAWGSLSWILDRAVTGSKASPREIPKTVLFIDDINDILDAVETLSCILLGKNADIKEGEKYADDDQRSAYSVTEVIRPFYSRSAEYDKDWSFAEFKEPDSKTRIMVATTSLGMGVNIMDIEYVICWRFPIGFDMADTYQKAGRGGRGPGRTSTVVLYLDYWAFNHLGQDPAEAKREKERQAQERRAQKQQEKADRFRAVDPSPAKNLPNTPTQASPLSHSTTFEDHSDAESDISISTTVTVQETKAPKIKVWTVNELAKQAALDEEWREVANGPCIRKPIIRKMGQKQTLIHKEKCCSRCNPARAQHPLRPPKVIRDNVRGQPGKNTRAAFALDFITKWVTEEAKREFSNDDVDGPIPIDIFMEEDCRWQLANLYNREDVLRMVLEALNLGIEKSFLVKDMPEILSKRVPSLSSWYYWDNPQYQVKLSDFLVAQEELVNKTYQEFQNQKKQKNQAHRSKRTPKNANAASKEESTSEHIRKAATIRQAQRSQAANLGSQSQLTISASSAQPATPNPSPQTQPADEHVPQIEILTPEEHNRTLETCTPLSQDSFEDIDDAELLTQYTGPQSDPTDYTLASPVSPCERPKKNPLKKPVPKTPNSPKVVSRKRQNPTPKSSQRKRQVLADIDPNTPVPSRVAKKQLTFTPETRSGRRPVPSRNASSVYDV